MPLLTDPMGALVAGAFPVQELELVVADGDGAPGVPRADHVRVAGQGHGLN